MAAISETTKDAVWTTKCDLEWHVRYFSAMHDHKRRVYRLIRLGLLLGVFVDGFLFFASTTYETVFYFAIALGIGLAGLTVWDAVSNYSTDAVASRIISAACRQLRRETEALWRQTETNTVELEYVESTLQTIQRRWETALQWAEPETNNKINKTAQLAANREIEQLHGIETTA